MRLLPNLSILLLAGALLLAPHIVIADPVTGYRSAQFGMSAEEVRATLDGDGITVTTEHKTDAGDTLIDGHLSDNSAVGIRYVFPAGHDQLALVVTFHPELGRPGPVKQRLQAKYGNAWADDMAEQWFEQLHEGMPDGVQDLMVWGGAEGNRTRFVRLWVFEDYLSVEYLDMALLQGR